MEHQEEVMLIDLPIFGIVNARENSFHAVETLV